MKLFKKFEPAAHGKGAWQAGLRILPAVGGSAALFIAFPYLHDLIGMGASALTMIPVMLAAWSLGMIGGGVYALLQIGLNLICYMRGYPGQIPEVIEQGGMMGFFILLMAGLLVGRMSDLRRRLAWELERVATLEQAARTTLTKVGDVSRVNSALAGFNETLMTLTTLEEYAASLLAVCHDLFQYTHGAVRIAPARGDRLRLMAGEEPPAGSLPLAETLRATLSLEGAPALEVALARAGRPFQPVEEGWLRKLTSPTLLALGGYRSRRELELSEEKYRAFVEASGAASVVFDPTTLIIMVNSEFEKLAGLSRTDMESKRRLTDFLHPDDCQRVLEESARSILRKREAACRLEARAINQDGQVRDILAMLRHMPGRGSRADRRFVATMIDVTEQKRTQRINHVLYRISSAANDARRLDDLYAAVHSALQELVTAENFYIALYDAKNDQLTFPYFVDQFDERPEPKAPQRGLTEYILRSGEPLLADPETCQRLEDSGEVDLIGTASIDWLGVPLKVQDQTIGVMVIQSYTNARRYTLDELQMLSFASGQVGMAIERRRGQDELEYLSLRDSLTGLYNRAYFEQEMRRLQDSGNFPVTVVMADLNGLKATNDTLGHGTGDELICRAAEFLQASFRSSDVIARLGGDEFCILLPSTGRELAARLVERLRIRMGSFQTGTDLPLSLSLGSATAREARDLLNSLRVADANMYLEKSQNGHQRRAGDAEVVKGPGLGQ